MPADKEERKQESGLLTELGMPKSTIAVFYASCQARVLFGLAS